MNSFSIKFNVKWSDVDPNMHLRHSVYMDFSDQTRIKYFDSKGVSFLDFRELQIGPILFSTTNQFYKEVLLNERVTVNCKLSEVSPDFRKWTIIHEIFKENSDLAAVITANGAWLDLRLRKIIAPPQNIIKTLNEMERVEGSIS